MGKLRFSYYLLTKILLSSCWNSDWLRDGRPRGRSSSPGGGKNFHFSIMSRPALRPTQPPIQWVPGTLSPELKWPGREADHSPPTNAEVQKTWAYTSTPPYVLMALRSISYAQGQLYLYFSLSTSDMHA
jgi:hypothetical protein